MYVISKVKLETWQKDMTNKFGGDQGGGEGERGGRDLEVELLLWRETSQEQPLSMSNK